MILITVLEFFLLPITYASSISMVPPWRPANAKRDLIAEFDRVYESTSSKHAFTALSRSVVSAILLAACCLIWLEDLLLRYIIYVVAFILLLLAIIVALGASVIYYLCVTSGRRDMVESCKQTYHKLRATQAKESAH